jgi:tripartite-type tricarboxylate transporter receptor subunit TctC
MWKVALLRAIGALIIGVHLALTANGAAAQDDPVAKFYKGRQVTLYISSAVGGGYDAYARLVGRYLGVFIPGSPTIVPVNMPGAGGGVVISHLLTIAPKDGSVIAALQPGNVTAPLLSVRNGPSFDIRRLVYIGSANSEDDACWVRSDAPVKSFRDVFRTPLLVGSGQGGTATDLPAAENNILGTKFKIISGYSGVNEVLLAIDRNEVQGVCGTGIPAMKTQQPAWVANGFVKLFVQETVEGSAKLNAAGIPRTVDFARTPEDRDALALIYIEQTFGRPFATPPDVPPERVAALRRAFIQALNDKQLLADAKNLNLDIDVLPGERLQTIVDDIYKTPPQVVERAKLALSYDAGVPR